MIYIALGVVIACQVLMVCLVLLAFLRVKKVYNDTKANFLSFIQPREEGKPSPLAETVQLAADEFSRSMIAKAKAVFMNQASIASRQGKIIEGEIAQEAMSGSAIGSLLSQVPMVQKSLKKNPLFGLALARLFGGGGDAPSASSQPGNGHNSQVKFNL